MVQLPATGHYIPQQLVRQPDDVIVPPTNQQLAKQEPGVRPARALPYALDARCAVQLGDGSVRIDFSNTGRATAVFQVRSGNTAHDPRCYTVESGKQLSGTWGVSSVGATDYDLSVHGPNGFLRAFKGSVAQGMARLEVQTTYDETTNRITLTISNPGAQQLTVSVLDKYTRKIVSDSVDPGAGASRRWSLGRFDGWYDFVITVAGDSGFEYQIAGHLETGKDSVSDPAMGGLV
jgi:phospholipase C